MNRLSDNPTTASAAGIALNRRRWTPLDLEQRRAATAPARAARKARTEARRKAAEQAQSPDAAGGAA